MALSDGAIIEIVDRQTLQPDLALNVYHYRLGVSLIAPSPAQVAEFWWNDCNSVIRDLQCDELLHIRVTCRDIDDSSNYGEYIVPEEEQPGLVVGGDSMPRQNAFGVKFIPAEPTVRPGSKRLAGPVEAHSGQWGLIVPATITALGDYGAHMSSQLNSLDPGFVMVPVILGLPNDDRPTRVEVEMQGYVVNPYITSQNTRKIGRGA